MADPSIPGVENEEDAPSWPLTWKARDMASPAG